MHEPGCQPSPALADASAKRWKLILEYDGNGDFGWQSQEGLPCAQTHLETAIAQLTAATQAAPGRIRVTVAGRTDRGVHALGQVVHVDIFRPIAAEQLVKALNYYLLHSKVRVIAAQLVKPDFHARYSATMRYYLYRMRECGVVSPLRANYVWQLRWPVNMRRIRAALPVLAGRHDFTSFRASGCQARSPVRTLAAIRLRQQADEWHLYLAAPAFLYNQVRIICGTLIDFGRTQPSRSRRLAITPALVREILAAKSRAAAGMTAPAHGLYFLGADYPDARAPKVPHWLHHCATSGDWL